MGEFKMTDEKESESTNFTKAQIEKMVDDMVKERTSQLEPEIEEEEDEAVEVNIEDYLNELVSKRMDAMLKDKKATKREVEPSGKAGMTLDKELAYTQLKAFGFKDPEDAYNKYFNKG